MLGEIIAHQPACRQWAPAFHPIGVGVDVADENGDADAGLIMNETLHLGVHWRRFAASVSLATAVSSVSKVGFFQ